MSYLSSWIPESIRSLFRPLTPDELEARAKQQEAERQENERLRKIHEEKKRVEEEKRLADKKRLEEEKEQRAEEERLAQRTNDQQTRQQITSAENRLNRKIQEVEDRLKESYEKRLKDLEEQQAELVKSDQQHAAITNRIGVLETKQNKTTSAIGTLTTSHEGLQDRLKALEDRPVVDSRLV